MANGLDAQQRIFASNPDDRRAFEALEEHFFLDGDWEALAGLYRKRIAAPVLSKDADQLAPLLFRLGQIQEERILDLSAASETYWTLARLDPSNRPALRQLRGIHARGEKWELVLQIAELESATTMPAYDRAAFETELGRTWRRHIGDSEEARRAYDRALEADPEFPGALAGLAALHEEAGRFDEAARILTRLTARLRGPERAPVWIALGTLHVKHLDGAAFARKCFDNALDDDPFQPSAVEWALLLATAEEAWEAVSELLERRFDLASGARHRAAVAVEASQLQLNHLGSRASARAWTDRACELAPDEISVLLAVAEVDRADGDRHALLRTLDRLITVAGNYAPRSALVDAAELHSQIGQPDAALDAIRRASQIRGRDDGRVLTIQATLLRAAGSKRELAEVLETLTALEAGVEDRVRVESLRELARLQEEDLADESSAQSTWRRAFALDPTHADTIAVLERFHRKHDDWDGLRETLETALSAANRGSCATLSASLGTLLLERFDEIEPAHRLFDTALAEEPDCPAALRGLRALAKRTNDPLLLLEICEREARACRDPERMAELARAAIPILHGLQRIEDALSWTVRWCAAATGSTDALFLRADFEAELGRIDEEIESRRKLARLLGGRERSDALRRQAELHLLQNDEVAAGVALELGLEEEPRDRETLDLLCTVYRRLDRAPELAQTLRRLVEVVSPDEQVATLEELASILQDPIGDLDAAIVVRWQLAERPTAPQIAITNLENLLESAGRNAELAQLLHTRRSRLGDESSEAFEIDLRRGALLLDGLGQSEEAAEIFSALHARHPENEEVLDQLERSLRVGDDARGLCDLIEKRAGWETDPLRKSVMHLERAALLEEALGEPMLACDLYERIVADVAGSNEAATAATRLEALLESSGQWQRLRDHLLARVEDLSGDPQATLRERIAAICGDRLHDIVGCARQLETIAESVTDRVHVWQRLGEIYRHELDRPADWLRVVESELAAQPARERELSLRIAAARLCLDEERRPRAHAEKEAYDHYERVLVLQPTHSEAVEVLAHHYLAKGRPRDTARVLELRLTGLGDGDPSEVNDLRLRLAKLYAESLGRDDRARPLLEAIRNEVGVKQAVADPLANLFQRIDAFEDLSALCREVIDRSDDSGQLLAWRVRLGASERRCGRLDAAATAYRAALLMSPADREIEEALIELYDELGEVDPLVELLEKRLPFATEDEVIEIRLHLARLHEQGRNEPLEALEHLEWILASHPQHDDAFAAALRLAEQIGQPERILVLLDRSLERPRPPADRVLLLERRGRLLADELGRPEQAVANFREALSLGHRNPSARNALRGQLEKLGRWPAVLDCLFIEASEAAPPQRVDILEAAATIAWTHVNPDASLPWLARLRAERPGDPELLSRIAEIHRRAGRFEAALRAHDEELALRSDPSHQHDLHLQRARLLERELHAPGRAIFAYQNALELSSDPSGILAELDRLYDTMGRPFERARILERRIADRATLESTDESIELRQTLAGLYCISLSKPELALPHLEANVAATRGDDREELVHLGALDAALRASARRDTWSRVAERQLELIEGDPTILESTPRDYLRFLREELARTYDVDLGHTDRAIEHLRTLAANDDGTDPPATARTGARLRSLLRRTGRTAELATCLAEHLDAGTGTGAEWLELARLREERLADLPGAVDAYRQAEANRESRLAAIRGRRRCSERLRDWHGLADALLTEYDEQSNLSRVERTTLARTLGDVCWRRLGSGERAASAYASALELDRSDRAALRSLIHVKESCSEFADAIPLYQRELELLDQTPVERHRRFEIWLRLATLFRETGEPPSKAIEAYRKAAAIEVLSAPDELCLARLYELEGDADEFSATFGRWCDRGDSAATVTDHLELARQHRDHDQLKAALARTARATEIAPQHVLAWLLLGELERAAGKHEKAANAFECAAELAAPDQATACFIVAAASIDGSDLERANQLLTRAIERDPGAMTAHVALARIADRQGRLEQTQIEAERALELGEADRLEPAVTLEIALLGGSAARNLGHRDASCRLFEIALGIDASQIDALEGKAEAHFEAGDFRAARELLERRLDLTGEYAQRAQHHAMVARGLEAEDLLDAAWGRYEEALEIDPSIEMAHAGLVRVHERADRRTEALAALERWVDGSLDPEQKALAALRAAEHALELGDAAKARRCLDTATRENPRLAPAWLLLCERVAIEGVDRETRRVCKTALEAIEPGPLSAQVSLRAAQLAELAGERDEAIAHYGEAVRWEPRCCEAVLCQSRLIRMSGNWSEADGVLARFIEAHPEQESPSLAQVHLERGRLLSGPLEEFEQAVVAYQKALSLQPKLAVARTALSALLSNSSDRWREALALHREILDAQPTTTTSLRAIVRLAEERAQPETAEAARTVLRALGQASPQECAQAPTALRIQLHAGLPMADPDDERLRRIAHQLREEIGGVLAEVDLRLPETADEEIIESALAIMNIESELTAPGLTRLDIAQRASLFSEIAALFLDPGGNGGEARYRDALDQAIGLWTRRKVRRIVDETSLAAIEAHDHTRFGNELRALAAAQALERNGGDLRRVLRALVSLDRIDDSQPRFEGAELATLVTTCESARRLLARITNMLCERLHHAHGSA